MIDVILNPLILVKCLWSLEFKIFKSQNHTDVCFNKRTEHTVNYQLIFITSGKCFNQIVFIPQI